MTILYTLLISLFWGGSYLAIKMSLEGFSPFLSAALRVLATIVFSLVYIRWQKIPLPKKRYVLQAIGTGAIGIGGGWALLFWGEQRVAPALAAIINATTPVFTIIFAVFFLRAQREKLTPNKWLGIIVGFAGVAVIFAPKISANSFHDLKGLLAVSGTAVCYGLSVAWLKKISPHISTMMTLLFQCIGALIILVPASLFYGMTHNFLTGQSLLVPAASLFYLSFFSTFVGFILFYRLLRDVGAVQATATTYLAPIVSVSLDYLVLGKWVGHHALLGALMVFAAIRLINKPALASPPATT